MYEGPAYSDMNLPSPVSDRNRIHRSGGSGFTRKRGLPE
jgi:hypothetical protein